MAMKTSHHDDERDQIKHFSHRHPLAAAEIHEEDEKGVCSGCEHDVVAGPAFACTKPGCGFLLHALCSDLPHRLRHRCHPDHPLTLLPAPGEFTCDACGMSGRGFTYHCGTCEVDLHVACAALPEVEHRGDHRHPLILIGGKVIKGGDFVCYGCNGGRVGWMYCCLACRCGLHLACAGGTDIIS